MPGSLDEYFLQDVLPDGEALEETISPAGSPTGTTTTTTIPGGG
ncbi:hypothetical protein BH24ACT4_BH24ACT4_02330 [soil metagenome]